MTREMEAVSDFVRQIECESAPIAIEEIKAHTDAPITIDARTNARRSSRRAFVPVAAAAMVACLIGAMFAFRPARESPNAVPDPDLSASVPTVVEATVPAKTAPQPSDAVPSEPEDVDRNLDVVDRLREIDAQRIERLRQLPGISGTAVVESKSPIGDESTSTRETSFTMLADGSFWSTAVDGTFASYDPSTGTSLGSYVDDEGQMRYQQVDGWADNSTGLSILLGGDPARLIGDVTPYAEVTIKDAYYEGRPATEIAVTHNLPRGTPQAEVLLIDDWTGLIVESALEWESSPGTRTVRLSRLSGLETTDELPATFPGSVPDGAVVERSGDPAGFTPVTIEQAADAFGPGFVVPSQLPGDAVVSVSESTVMYDTTLVTHREVTIQSRQGFVTTMSIAQGYLILSDDAVPPPGMAVVDGVLCHLEDDACATLGGGNVAFAAGALAGLTGQLEDTTLSIDHFGRQIIIRSIDGHAIEVAESLTAWRP